MAASANRRDCKGPERNVINHEELLKFSKDTRTGTATYVHEFPQLVNSCDYLPGSRSHARSEKTRCMGNNRSNVYEIEGRGGAGVSVVSVYRAPCACAHSCVYRVSCMCGRVYACRSG